MQFAEILSKLMQEKEVTAYRIGKDTGISNRLITYWKDGEKMPGAENLKRLANYFCVSTDYLLGKEQKEKPTLVSKDELNDAEKSLLKLFRLVPSENQDMILQMIEAALKSQGLLE